MCCFAENLPETTSHAELHRKVLANAFWNGELEKELRESDKADYIFSSTSDREKAMDDIDQQRATSVYTHTCSKTCQERGKEAGIG